jgi:hypothetical protein
MHICEDVLQPVYAFVCNSFLNAQNMLLYCHRLLLCPGMRGTFHSLRDYELIYCAELVTMRPSKMRRMDRIYVFKRSLFT